MIFGFGKRFLLKNNWFSNDLRFWKTVIDLFKINTKMQLVDPDQKMFKIDQIHSPKRPLF